MRSHRGGGRTGSRSRRPTLWRCIAAMILSDTPDRLQLDEIVRRQRILSRLVLDHPDDQDLLPGLPSPS